MLKEQVQKLKELVSELEAISSSEAVSDEQSALNDVKAYKLLQSLEGDSKSVREQVRDRIAQSMAKHRIKKITIGDYEVMECKGREIVNFNKDVIDKYPNMFEETHSYKLKKKIYKSVLEAGIPIEGISFDYGKPTLRIKELNNKKELKNG